MQNIMKGAQENLLKSKLPPIFADEAVIITPVRSTKDKGGKVKKEGHVVVAFIDMTNQNPVSKIVMNITTARNLATALTNSLDRLEKDLKSKAMPEKADPKAESAAKYIG